MSAFITVITTILVFMAIILIHELGHFTAAKLLGVKVHEFSVGMGPVLYKRQKGETQYAVRALPIGGFVRLEGEDEHSEDERSMSRKPVWARLIIVSAGAIVNIICGLIIFLIIFMQVPQMPTMTIEQTMQGSPAYDMLLAGDKIVAIDHTRVWYYKDLMFQLAQKGSNASNITVVRDGKTLDFQVTPMLTEVKQEGESPYKLGILFGQVKMTPLRAIQYGIFETLFIIRLVLFSLFMLITGKVAVTQLAGPVGTSTAIGEAAKRGFGDLLNIAALLSVNVGIFNIIPLPALDGGRIFFMLIELVRGKPINPEKEGTIHFVGLVLLLALMVVVTSSDIYKLVMGVVGK